MCETLTFIQTGCSILSVAYYERFWRFCGYRCVSKDKLTGRRSGHTVTRTQFYFFPRGKDVYTAAKMRDYNLNSVIITILQLNCCWRNNCDPFMSSFVKSKLIKILRLSDILYLWRLPWQQAADQSPFPRMPRRFLHSNHFLSRKQNQPRFSHMRFPSLHDASHTDLLRHRIGLFKNLPERKILIRLYSTLPITRTLAKLEPKSITPGFPSYLYCNFTLGNSNPR